MNTTTIEGEKECSRACTKEAGILSEKIRISDMEQWYLDESILFKEWWF